MSTNWTTIVNSTTAKYLKQVEVNIMRSRKLLKLLQQRGRVVYNDSGVNLDWKVQYKRAPLTAFADGETISFARRDRHKTATLDWRAYVLTDLMSKADRLKNRSVEAIINYYANIVDWMVEEIEEQFGDELYANGVSSTRRIHGIESFLSDGGSVASSPIRLSNSTYAGLSCTRGTYGGSWTGTWPDGYGDSQYDFWSPLLVDYTHTTAWGGSTHTWVTHGLDAMRYGIMKTRKFKSAKGMMDLIILNEELYRAYKGVIDDKEQINVNRGQRGDPGDVSLGFGDSTWLDGCEVTWEYGIAANVGYGFNANQMELRSQQAELFVPSGPFFDEDTQTHKFMVDFYGNMRFNPRSFLKLSNYSG